MITKVLRSDVCFWHEHTVDPSNLYATVEAWKTPLGTTIVKIADQRFESFEFVLGELIEKLEILEEALDGDK